MQLPARCVDLGPAHVAEAMRARANMRKLLLHMAAVARPNEGAAKIFVLVSRIASDACTWMEKTGLHVEIRDGRRGTTEILVTAILDESMRELLFPRLLLAVERSELVRAIGAAPDIIAPMTASFERERVVLTCPEAIVGTISPPAFLETEAAFRRSISPALRRSLAPLATFDAPVIPRTPRRPTLLELDDIDDRWEPAPAPTAPTVTRRPKYRTPLSTDAPRPALRRKKG